MSDMTFRMHKAHAGHNFLQVHTHAVCSLVARVLLHLMMGLQDVAVLSFTPRAAV